jgi:hypothetical protein
MKNMIDRSNTKHRKAFHQNLTRSFDRLGYQTQIRIKDKEAIETAQEILHETSMCFYNKNIPKKWHKIFAITKFAQMFFEKYKEKIIITDIDFYCYFQKRGHNIDEESTFLEILNAAKSIARIIK